MEILQTPYGNFLVYVNRLDHLQDNIYHVSFVDKDNKTQVILMQRTLDGWSVSSPQNLPGWLMGLQHQLCDVVQKEHQKELQESMAEPI
jgi:hypothetical protein